jgi:hypothetical protein
MDLELFQKYLYTICFGYFCVKIYYKLLFTEFNVKDSHKELVDFSVTCVIASIVYLITNFNYPMNNSIFFYVGFIVGTQIIVLNKILFPTNVEDYNSNLKEILFYMLLITYSVIFIYFYIIQNIGINIVNPLIIIIGIISIVIGLIITSNPNKTSSSIEQNQIGASPFNTNLGFLSLLGSLLFINTPSTNVIVTFFQSILIGVFVSEFSYNGPKYFIDKVENKQNTNLNEPSNEDIIQLNKNIVNYNRNFNKYCNFKNEIETSKIISGLSYITVLIIITVVYINLKDNDIL